MTRLRPSAWFAAGAILLLLAPSIRGDAGSDYADGLRAHARGDVVAAMEHLQRSADAGHVPAMVRLAFLLDLSEQNEEALALYERAARAGSAEAALALGVMYAGGDGVERDAEAALQWITRAAQAGYGPATVTLAQVYLRGELGVAADRERARHWLARGEAAGHEPARVELERLLTAGAEGARP